MKGQLWEGVLPGVLRALYVGRQTGILTFSRGDERRSVHFRRGNIVSADTNVAEGRMGEVLVKLGRLNPTDLERAGQIVVWDKKRLGVALVELGVLSEEGLEEAVATHVHDLLCQVFAWNEGFYEFDESDDLRTDGDVTLRFSTGELILQAARSVEDPDVVRYNLGDLNRVLALPADPLLRFQRISLTPVDGYLLSRVDGTLAAREVIQLIPLPVEEVQRSLFGLLSTGLIEFVGGPPKEPPAEAPAASRPKEEPAAASEAPAPPSTPEPPPPIVLQAEGAPSAAPPQEGEAAKEELPPLVLSFDPDPAAESPALPTPEGGGLAPKAVEALRVPVLEAHASLKSRSHFEVLGIPRQATDSQVREAYFRLAKQFHPDAHHDPALSDLRDKLEEIFSRLGEAYEVLRNPRIRAMYERELLRRDSVTSPSAGAVDPAQDAELAAESIKKAEDSIARDRYWEAIPLLESAIPRVQGPLKQQARILLARAYAKHPNWVKQGEELLLSVLRQDPRNAEAHLQLGLIFYSQELRSRALASFRRVLEIEPDNEEAIAYVGELDPDAPSGGDRGLLKRLFRRG